MFKALRIKIANFIYPQPSKKDEEVERITSLYGQYRIRDQYISREQNEITDLNNLLLDGRNPDQQKKVALERFLYKYFPAARNSRREVIVRENLRNTVIDIRMTFGHEDPLEHGYSRTNIEHNDWRETLVGIRESQMPSYLDWNDFGAYKSPKKQKKAPTLKSLSDKHKEKHNEI